jgi:hypothetical protein
VATFVFRIVRRPSKSRRSPKDLPNNVIAPVKPYVLPAPVRPETSSKIVEFTIRKDHKGHKDKRKSLFTTLTEFSCLWLCSVFVTFVIFVYCDYLLYLSLTYLPDGATGYEWARINGFSSGAARVKSGATDDGKSGSLRGTTSMFSAFHDNRKYQRRREPV